MPFFLNYPEKFKGDTLMLRQVENTSKIFCKIEQCSLNTGNNGIIKMIKLYNDVAMFQYTTSNMYSSAWFSKYKYTV